MPKKNEDKEKTPRQTVKFDDLKIDEKLTEIGVAFMNAAQSGVFMMNALKAMQDVLAREADTAMADARRAAGPFAGGVKDQREGRPVFEGFLTVCAKCFGLKRLDDCVWSDSKFSAIELQRFNRLGLSSAVVTSGTCKSCVGIDRDDEGTITRAIDLEDSRTVSVNLEDGSTVTVTARPGDTITTTSPIKVPAEQPIGVAMTGGKAGDTITVRLADVVFEVPNETSGSEYASVDVSDWTLTDTDDVKFTVDEATMRRRPMMINTGSREERYGRRPKRERPPFPGKKMEPVSDITKARSRQIVLDED